MYFYTYISHVEIFEFLLARLVPSRPYLPPPPLPEGLRGEEWAGLGAGRRGRGMGGDGRGGAGGNATRTKAEGPDDASPRLW